MNSPEAASRSTSAQQTVDSLKRYYRFHSQIYDATRWSFLFGRTLLIREIEKLGVPARVLEVGCGTGRNLLSLRQAFPQAELTGLDISTEMLTRARRKITDPRIDFVQKSYDQPLSRAHPFDLVVFSYSLSMINPGWEQALDNASEDIAPGTFIAVVDFHGSALAPFKRWMGVNHVRMDGHLLPGLETRFKSRQHLVKSAYGGLWKYFIYIGEK